MAEIEAFHVMDVQTARTSWKLRDGASCTWKSASRTLRRRLWSQRLRSSDRQRRLGYTASIGIPELRQAISDHYRERLGVTVPSSRIVVTAGASGAFLLTLGALVNPGDEVLMPDPCYPCNRHFVRLARRPPPRSSSRGEPALPTCRR